MSATQLQSDTTHPSSPSRETFQRGLIGSVVLLLIIAGTEALFLGPGYFDRLTLHPFWIVIIIAAMQNGVAVGVATSVIAALLVGLPERLVNEDAAVYAARAAVQPLQWFVVALIIGFYRQKEIEEVDGLRTDVARLEGVSARLADEVERMDIMVADFESEAASRPAPEADTNPKEQLFQRALPQLAALAGSQGSDLPHRFEDAADALFDAPVALVVSAQGRGEFVIGTTPVDETDATALAKLVSEHLKDQKGASHTVLFKDLGISKEGAVRIARQRPKSQVDMAAMVIFYALDRKSADAAAANIEILSELSRIAIDRLNRDLNAQEPRQTGAWDSE
ncbi:hypothetical protein ACGYKB_18445 [Sulfitobacter sp. 916]|uniref:hypothetical protein n=1 Tax=Sulfitobacter sp. 916 TaxID=3368559 RepID=UPI0037474802